MKRLLVTGASGFLGWNICHFAPQTWQKFGTVFSHKVTIPNVIIIKTDLTDFRGLKELFRNVCPDAVINTAATSDPNLCQVNSAESRKINVDAAVNLASLCADSNIPYVFTSTDLVFDGLNAPYKETDPLYPVNVYGEQKVMAEKDVLKSYPMAAICRMPLMFGVSGAVTRNFFQAMMAAMKKGQKLNLFVDEFRTPVSAKTAVSGLFLALQKVKGLIHLGGIESISRYEFGRLMVKIFEFGNVTLIPCQQKDLELAAPRPLDVSLDSTKAFALGYKPLPLEKELEEIYQGINFSCLC